MKLLLGDCIDKLKELDDNSIDSIVTDPPYGLSFMGKKWDYDVPSQEIFEECLRVLKPGGHLLAFAGSRTYHRMAVRIEDAGFEIRDQIMWIYGSGFPKSMNIGIQVDKKLGNQRELVERPKSEQRPNADKNRDKNKDVGGFAMSDNKYKSVGNSEWEGWGTALKPAHEPIVMARKPLSEKTVVDNVLEWGTGGINIDESRISTDDNLGGGATKGSVLSVDGFDRPWMHDEEKMKEFSDKMKEKVEHAQTLGRFPANIIFDEDAGKILDEQSGNRPTGVILNKTKGWGKNGIYGSADTAIDQVSYGDEGGASRFFYCPKTSKKDRNEGLDGFVFKNGVKQFTDKGGLKCKKCNKWKNSGNPCQCDEPDFEQQQWNGTLDKNSHPTVKPTDLMLYLIRLVTPKGGTALDPFMGSGSTGKAAVRGGFDFVGIEMEKEYMEIAEARIQYEQDNPYNEEKGERVKINKNSNKFW